jgi:HEAT repeat protein
MRTWNIACLRPGVAGRFFTVILLGASCYAAESAQESAWKVIDASLAEKNYERRLEALESIGTIANPDAEAIRRAENALQDKETLVREAAALVLGELKAESSIPKLQALLQDKGEVAFAAAKALAALGDNSGRDFLIAVVGGERKDVQPGIMTNAMRKAKDDLHHPGDLVFMGAGDATGAMFGPAGMVFPAMKDTVDLKGKGAPGRAAAAAYLAKDPEPYAITLLEWALGDDNEFVRLEAAKGLGQRGNSGSIQKLWPLLSDDKNFVRDMAAAAVIRIQARDGERGDPADGLPQVTTKKR